MGFNSAFKGLTTLNWTVIKFNFLRDGGRRYGPHHTIMSTKAR